MIATSQPARSGVPILEGLELNRLRRRFERVSLSHGETIQRMHAPIEHVYFPVSCVLSLIRTTSAGGQLESALIGSESSVGWPARAEQNSSTFTVVALVPGDAYRIPLAAMKDEIDVSPTWRRFVESQQATLSETLAITATCSCLHSITERCCRWLLTVQNFLNVVSLPFTQSLIAQHLGVHRPNISQVFGRLQAQQIIDRTHRSSISILDRTRLEAKSCDCHRLLDQNRRRAIGVPEVRSWFPVRPTG